jgi:hypothetical protein
MLSTQLSERQYHEGIPNRWSDDPEWSGMITSGSCCYSSATYARRDKKWKEELPKPKENNEPRRLFCSSCNGYTYSDSRGSCMNCGHVREKVIEPITLYQ